MKNLSKKHLKQIYRRKMSNNLYVLIPAVFFRVAPNNRKDHDKMMTWQRSMCTNIRYMIPGEKIKRRSKRT